MMFRNGKDAVPCQELFDFLRLEKAHEKFKVNKLASENFKVIVVGVVAFYKVAFFSRLISGYCELAWSPFPLYYIWYVIEGKVINWYGRRGRKDFSFETFPIQLVCVWNAHKQCCCYEPLEIDFFPLPKVPWRVISSSFHFLSLHDVLFGFLQLVARKVDAISSIICMSTLCTVLISYASYENLFYFPRSVMSESQFTVNNSMLTCLSFTTKDLLTGIQQS